jgi:hypothetical protein
VLLPLPVPVDSLSNKITSAGAAASALNFLTNNCLTDLSLRVNEIEDEGATALAVALGSGAGMRALLLVLLDATTITDTVLHYH